MNTRDLIAGSAAFAAVCVGFGFENGWLWSWGAVCGIVGTVVIVKLCERLSKS